MAEKEFIEREAASRVLCDACGNAACPKGLIPRCSYYEKMQSIPAADVPPALWTDEPIIGTEFVTHNQGQRGFEIHFLTDDKAKYEAVQDECRRQIGHAKPAAAWAAD